MASFDTDSVWLLLAAAMVGFLPIGLLAIELSGSRVSTARSAPARMGSDVVVAVLLTWLLGFSWVHGPSLAGVFGLSPGPVVLDGPSVQWRSALATWYGFAVAAAVVIAGAGGSERARPVCSLLVAMFMAGLVMPIAGHWIQGGRPDGVPVGWLGRLDFLDHGAAALVHVAAGAAGVALSASLGPRRGRYDAIGRARVVPQHSPSLQVLGAILAVVGCLGLLAGGRYGWREDIPGALLLGLIGAAAGVVGAVACNHLVGPSGRSFRPARLGAVAGVVATSGGALLGGPIWALIAGLAGGCIAVAADLALLRAGIDDPVGVGGAHLAAGIWAAVAAAVAVSAPGLPGRLVLQLVGALAVAAFSGALVHGLLWLADRWVPLRVSPFSEEFGTGELSRLDLP